MRSIPVILDREFFLETGYNVVSTTAVTCYRDQHSVSQASAVGTLPSFCAASGGSIWGLRVQLDAGGFGTFSSAVMAGDTLTIKIQRSTNEGSTWSDLTGSAVQVALGAGTSSGSDLTHVGSFNAGDWISVSAVGTNGAVAYRGGIRFKLRYSE